MKKPHSNPTVKARVKAHLKRPFTLADYNAICKHLSGSKFKYRVTIADCVAITGRPKREVEAVIKGSVPGDHREREVSHRLYFDSRHSTVSQDMQAMWSAVASRVTLKKP